ncbi:hypothetical protein CLPU_10c01190 [Gottschalkia purinilytica]|uniref:Uncharacterized protein n=1 Tax=Gottschalkia purinilytica TaxID=1503 RepID=A0A0L0W943_GOTPU|nr:hypothetical protein [Gottschalkia purinilytica]KNF08064.1 hypothetical protein CLPU_10c01190 [Gottschalkia purinilytica]
MNNSRDVEKRDWIIIRTKRKNDKMPSEIRVDLKGNVFIDGELYDETNTKYKNLSVSVDVYNRMNTGEETEEMLKSKEKAKEGEIVPIKDIKSPTRSESTTVKF